MCKSINLKSAVAEYIQHQTEVGQKASTLGTIKRSLELLVGEMGEDKEVSKILPVHIAMFFKSEAATTQTGKDGTKPRAPASILQIRRIVRSALVYWQAQDYSKAVPLPADEKKFIEPKQPKKAKSPKPTPEPETPAEVATETGEPNASADATSADQRDCTPLELDHDE